jgi:conjugative relaxase-like TrwC/TraI family protein
MLSIGKLGAGQETYYTAQVAEGAEDYYSGKGEAEGTWLGEAARELGLEGAVDPAQLTAMLTGINPATGEPLGLRAVGGRGPVPGFDLTFSAPKSVSLLWALGGAEAGPEVAAAHHASVEAALAYLQRHACLTRRGADAKFVTGNGFLAAAYMHCSSRAGDPQLHTHVLIANATKGPDGCWTRLYHPVIYDHAKTAGYLYEAQLRHELTQRLGVRWQEVRRGIAEIEGFDDEHSRRFSTRRKQILEAAGPNASARARQVATLTTREVKEEVDQRTLRERWQETAREIDLTPELLAAATGREQRPALALTLDQLDQAVTAHASHFDRRDAIQAVADNLRAGAPAKEVEMVADTFLSSDEVISIGATAKGERFTTRRIWEIEQRALEAAERMAGADDRAVAGELITARVIAARPSLKPDQREMVKRLLTGGEGLSIVIGEAGSGKTYAVMAAASGWAALGRELRVAAPTWRAANVLRSEGLEASSLARLLAQMDADARQGRPALLPGSVLMVDEAGMVDSASLARLIDHAETARAKLVLIGDPEQLGEIEAGGLFRALAERHEPIVLDEVIRHRHELDREAAKRIRQGRGAEGLSLYRTAGRVTIAPDADARREAMVADWWQSFGAGEDALIVAKRNAEVERLNELAREVMREQGRLGKQEIVVGEHPFAVGDQVITRINDHKAHIYNRERWRVAGVDVEAQAVVLDGIDTRGRVCVDAVYLGRVTENGDPALQHAYAATTYQAQGATVDRAYVMADPSMDKQELYVAASRSREETWLYATPEIQFEREEFAPRSAGVREGLAHIAEAAERDGAQVAAHDQALRSSLGQLSTPELARRREELVSAAGSEQRNETSRRRLSERIEEFSRYEQGAAMQPAREAIAKLSTERDQLAPVVHGARSELAVVDHLLAERQRLVVTEARLSPPTYITREQAEPSARRAIERTRKSLDLDRQQTNDRRPARSQIEL